MRPLKAHSATERILAYLAKGHRLTAIQALHKFDCMSLSQRCGFLRRRGHDIHSRLIPTRTGKLVAQYWMQ